MEFVTIRDFANSQGISYEAVRKQLKKYADELNEHISVKGRTKYLDTYAVDFLSKKRRESPVILLQQDAISERERLKEEADRLKNALLDAQQKIIELQEDNKKMIGTQAKYEALEQSRVDDEAKILRQEKELSEVKIELSQKQSELQDAQEEISSFQKTIFGLYKKVK